MFSRPVCLALALACVKLLSAQDPSIEECKQHLQTPLPAEASQIPAPKTWPDCNSYKLYSGIGTKVDYAASRKCAWSERLAQLADLEPRYTIASLFGGSAMLSVLYANGEGVDQNKSLALRFACESGLAQDAAKDIGTLPNESHLTQNKFKYCDEVRTTLEIGFCASWDAEIADQERTAYIDAMSRGWPDNQKTALRTLFRDQSAYSKAHAKGELDLGGSGRAIWQFDAEQTLRSQFLAAIKSFESGKLPSGSAKPSKVADMQLNALYHEALATAEAGKSNYGAIQPEGIRDAERAWLRYRDDWVKFGGLRYPAVARDAWLTLLTNDRVAILRNTFCEMGSNRFSCDDSHDGQAFLPLP
jgi:uncharacterized protein YecT (DUF1311 family)